MTDPIYTECKKFSRFVLEYRFSKIEWEHQIYNYQFFQNTLIKPLLEIEEFSQNRQKNTGIQFILSIEGSKVKVTNVQ